MPNIAERQGQPPPEEVGEGRGGRNLNAPFTKLRRTGQEAAKTELFEARAARHYARQHAGPAGRNLTADLNLPVLRANYVCSENSQEVDSLPLWDEKSRKQGKIIFG